MDPLRVAHDGGEDCGVWFVWSGTVVWTSILFQDGHKDSEWSGKGGSL